MASKGGLLCLMIMAGFFLAILAYAAQADDTSLGAVGYGVVPLDNDQVTMAAERVEAEIRGDQAWVTCVFTFTNTGPAVEVLMGFPQAQSLMGGESKLMDFRAFVDSEDVPVIFRPNAQPQGDWDYAGWYTFNVSFAAGQTRVVRNTYHGRLNLVSNGSRAFEYILHTGATWRDAIEQVDIVVRWQKDRDVRPDTISASPSGYVQGQRELHWHFIDLEPDHEDDIRVFFRPIYGPSNLGMAAASSGRVQPATIGYGLPAALFSDSDPVTAWQAEGETKGAWVIWSYDSYPHYATPTLGLGILPGMAGDMDAFLAHGRPREVLVRLVRLKDGVEMPPMISPTQRSFLNPGPGLEITEHRLVLEDTPCWQFMRLEKPAIVLAFQVVVESIYPGEQYGDVAIAEVLFPLLEEDLESAPGSLPVGRGEGSRRPGALDSDDGRHCFGCRYRGLAAKAGGARENYTALAHFQGPGRKRRQTSHVRSLVPEGTELLIVLECLAASLTGLHHHRQIHLERSNR